MRRLPPRRGSRLRHQHGRNQPPTTQQLRSDDQDPAHGGTAATKRSESVSRNNTLTATWRPGQTPHEPIDFATDILPLVADIPLPAIAKATGLSESYCSVIRRGIEIPHERHWEKLWSLVESQPAEQ
jgi:hypothetical protein